MSYILDTNILMDNFSIKKYSDGKIYLPLAVLEEIDKHSHSDSKEKRYLGRIAKRNIQELDSMGKVEYVTKYEEYDIQFSSVNCNDNIILLYAKTIQNKDQHAVLFTADLNMYHKAKALGVKSEFVSENKGNICKGYLEIVGTTENINKYFFEIDKSNLYPNQYLIIKDISTGESKELRWNGDEFVGLKLPPSTIIKAKNSLQRCALDLLMNQDITTVAIMGLPGSGKSFLCMQMASYFVQDKHYQNKILGIREPNAEGKEIGFLKGDFAEKTNMFFKPIEQQMKSAAAYEYLVATGVVETTIPYYLKGTTYDKTIMFVDEAEDLEEGQLRLIGTRAGEGTRVFFSGDYGQSIVNKTYNNPLVKMCEELKGEKMFGFIYLDEDVRSETSKMFADLFKKTRGV